MWLFNFNTILNTRFKYLFRKTEKKLLILLVEISHSNSTSYRKAETNTMKSVVTIVQKWNLTHPTIRQGRVSGKNYWEIFIYNIFQNSFTDIFKDLDDSWGTNFWKKNFLWLSPFIKNYSNLLLKNKFVTDIHRENTHKWSSRHLGCSYIKSTIYKTFFFWN